MMGMRAGLRIGVDNRIADGIEHVVAVRRTNVVIDAVGAGSSIEVAIPRSDPSGFAGESGNQVIAVGLVDVG